MSNARGLSDGEALRVSEERFRLIFETAFQFMALLDGDGTLREINRAVLAWLGVPRDAAVGLPLWDTPWFSAAPDSTRLELQSAVADAAAGRFVRYDVSLPGPDGTRYVLDFSLTPIKDDGGHVRAILGEGRDITELKRLEIELRDANLRLRQAEERSRQVAITDDLTGLYNRRGFFILGEQQKRLGVRTRAQSLLMFIDIDGLKQANDEYGHEAGDALIVGASTVLARTFRASDLVARLGGDEFAVLAALSTSDTAERFTSRLGTHLEAFNRRGVTRTPLRVSIGVHEFVWASDMVLEDLVARADEAMYAQKRGKKPPARR